MPAPLVKVTDTTFKAGLPYVKVDAGWVRAKTLWRKTSSTVWTSFYVVDNTPPASPVIVEGERDGTRLKITITAPASSDVVSLRVKVATKQNTNLAIDSDYLATPDGVDDAWSEWKVTPGQTRTKYWPMEGTPTNNTTYYVTAWAQDSSRNFSSPVFDQILYRLPSSTVSKPKSGYAKTTDSSTFRRSGSSDQWYREKKYLYLGGPKQEVGVWFYGTNISTLLKNASAITAAKLTVQRRNADYDGTAKFFLLAHNMTGYSNINLDNGHVVRTQPSVELHAKQGQDITVTIPDTWYDEILSGTITGFGLYSQLSSANSSDPYNSSFYGAGSNSGRAYFEWTE